MFCKEAETFWICMLPLRFEWQGEEVMFYNIWSAFSSLWCQVNIQATLSLYLCIMFTYFDVVGEEGDAPGKYHHHRHNQPAGTHSHG